MEDLPRLMPPPGVRTAEAGDETGGECKLSATIGLSRVGDRVRGRVTILHDGVRLEQSEKLILGVAVGHAGHVIADRTLWPITADAAAVALRQQPRRP